MMYHFFYIGTYSPQSTKVLLGYVVMYAKIYIGAKWDLGTLGGKYSFLQIYTDFVPNWLNIIQLQLQLWYWLDSDEYKSQACAGVSTDCGDSYWVPTSRDEYPDMRLSRLPQVDYVVSKQS